MNRWSRFAPLTGVVFFGVLLASIILSGNTPSTTTSGAKVIGYFTAHRDRMITTSILTAVAVVVGVFFYAALRDYLRRDEKVAPLATTAFAGAVIFAVGGAANAGFTWALIDVPNHLTPQAAQTLNVLYSDGTYGFTAAGIAILLVAYGLAIVRSDLLPHWLGWLGFPLAIVAISPAYFIALAFTGIWTLSLSILVYARSTRLASTEAASVPATGSA
jgi:hypothetical protein